MTTIASADLPSAMPRTRALIVLGPHRSGTSALTRVISLLGADLPSGLLAAQPDNPAGFWESLELMQIHEAMLASAGSSWEDVSRIAPPWFGSAAAHGFERAVAELLRRDFARSPLFVIKDPRICRLVPFWLRVLRSIDAGPAFIIPVRNPLEVAASLKRRDGFQPARALLLWLRHMLDAERDTRDQARSIVSYEHLLTSWRSVVDQIAVDLGLVWPRRSHLADAEIEAFLSAEGRHHTHSVAELNARPDVTDWVKRVYAAFRTAAEGGGLAVQLLDAVRAELETADLAFGPVLAERQLSLTRAQGELEAARTLVTIREADVAQLRGELEATQALSARQESETARVSQELEAAKGALATAEAEAATGRAELSATRTALATAEAEATAGRAELSATRTALATAEAEATAGRTELAATRTALATAEAEATAGRTELAATRTALATAEAGLSGRRHELDAAQRALAESRSLTGGLRAELTGARASGRIIVNSSSWKLTKPLRQLIEALSYVGELGLARTISSMVKRNFVKQLHLRRQLAVVEESGMFDASWYLAQSPDAAQTQVDPVRHYLLFGAAEGLDPHPLFDTSWYLERYPDVGRAGLNPLVHYLVRGALEGRHPHPHCDTAATSEHPTDVALADIPRPTPVLRRQPLTARLDPSRCLALDREGPWLMCVSHVRPDPPRAGNAYRIQRMLRWAANTGYRVLLIHAPLPEEEPSDDALAELASVYPHLVVCRRDGRIHYRFEDGAEVPAALAHLHGRPAKGCPGDGPETNRRAAELHAIERTFAHDTLVETVLALADTLKPSVVLAEYVFMTRFFPRLPAETLKVIDTHDVFSTKGKKVERYGIRDSLALSAGEESRYLARADVIIAIQPDEAKDLSRLAPGKRVVTAGVDFDLVPLPPAAQSRVVLLIGSGNAMNVRAAEDFVRFAWPLIRRQVPEAELWMAGRVSQVATFQSTGVNPLGLVEDLDPLYRAARVTINPVVAGTGVKIKTLESLSRLRPVVCWPTGVEGLGPELRAHCSLADNWYDFAVQVIRQLQDDTPQSALWSAQDRLGPLLAAQAVYSDLHTALATTSATIEARAP